jgi:hypothetical protein
MDSSELKENDHSNIFSVNGFKCVILSILYLEELNDVIKLSFTA